MGVGEISFVDSCTGTVAVGGGAGDEVAAHAAAKKTNKFRIMSFGLSLSIFVIASLFPLQLMPPSKRERRMKASVEI